jgi:tetratricopeptide (TPR) repeat protein
LGKHLTDLRMEGMFLAQAEADRETLLHLLLCQPCRERFEEIGRRLMAEAVEAEGREQEAAPSPPPRPVSTREAMEARERAEAPGLFVELLQILPEDRDARLHVEERFRTWSLAELFLERSRETATRNPQGAEELARLALVLADRLSAALYGRDRIEDLRARAWSLVGNARRVRSDLKGAAEAFRVARSHLSPDAADPRERAAILDREASLRRDERRFDEAVALLKDAIETFRGLGEKHLEGRSLVNLAVVHHHAGDLERAIVLLQEALPLLDPEREPRVLLNARHNLAFYLAGAGRFEEALAAYREARPLYREFPEPWVENRRRWVRGRILRGLGRTAAAEKLLLKARDGFVDEGIPYDTALAALELATLYAEQERTADLKRLAGEMVPIFSSLSIHREALAALAVLKQAMEREEAGVEMVRAVAEFLERARFEPELRFQR